MSINPVSINPVSINSVSTNSMARAYATRAAVVATTSAAAALLTVLPAMGLPAMGLPAMGATAPTAAPAITPAAVVTAPFQNTPVQNTPVQNTPVENVALASPASAGQTAVANAMSKIGAPYAWGGNGPSSFDCSGLVNWAFSGTGVELPRTSQALSQVGTPVSKADLQPGDLVFFYTPVSHVGIYIGNGQMVNASNSSKPVSVDSIEGREYHSARRV